ncbi:hypothetical protein DGMP_11670 [Desulfomarina profundi]|uniref:CRISPR-associated protein Cas6 C-terminal domain-containing protein n=1 Tax=Desulfomarina profundi TaxID=2772557 RepID=A0A8D5FRM1_9BACT|nr:CRISPR system precrRNA processing endoribonuclease RAMP protein Cas6 [Desulfomarina profundi]BCL60474.1 hypothetical protein DGMP_11670 [Desulfomarina profundi]
MNTTSSITNPLFNLETGRFRFICKRNSRIEFNNDFCARLRGSIGFLIKKNCCVYKNFRERSCPECLLSHSCSYPQLFDPPLPPPRVDAKGILRIGHPPPRPFVLSAVEDSDDNSLLQVEFCLFGPALKEAAFFLDMAGSSLLSIHSENRPFLTGIVDFQPLTPGSCANTQGETYIHSLAEWIACEHVHGKNPDACRRVTLSFRSPLCLVKAGKKNLPTVLPEILLKTVVRRLRDLKRAYGKDTNMGKIENHIFKNLKKISCVGNNLHPATGVRYSYRQEKWINLPGITGKIVYNTVHPALLVFLQCGQIIQIGKGTSWGLGNMQIDCTRNP